MSHQAIYRRPTVIVGVAFALVLVAAGIFAPVLALHDPQAVNLSEMFCPPVSCEHDGRSHVLGTDFLGRDVLSRIVTSFRTNLYIGLLGTFLGILGALLLIIVRGIRSAAPAPYMLGPLFGVPFYRLAILTYLTGVFLSIVVVRLVGASFMVAIICAGVFSSLLPMTLLMESVRGDGSSPNPVRLAFRRAIALSPVGFSLALLMGLFIESSLSFLGVGVPPNIPSLGGLIPSHQMGPWWIVVFPLGIVLAAVAAFSAIVIPVGSTLKSRQPEGGSAAPAYTPAGFWRRLAAYLIDLLVLIVLCIIYAIIAPQSVLAGNIVAMAFIVGFVWVLVISPGKRVLGLYVLRADGSRVGVRRKFCRVLFGLLAVHIDILMIVLRRDRRGLHDLICDTVVVRR